MTQATSPTTTVVDPPLVEVVGDSIAMLTTTELRTNFRHHGWEPSITANSSTTVETNRQRLRDAAAHRPRALVVELGTNDAGQIGNALEHPTAADRTRALARTARNIAGALEDLASLECVVWVDVNDWTNAPFYDVRATAPIINAALLAEDAARPAMHLVAYRAVFEPRDAASSTWLRANFDGPLLHPASPAARQRIADLVTDAVATHCGI